MNLRRVVVPALAGLCLLGGGCGESRLTQEMCEQVSTGRLAKAQGSAESLYGDGSANALPKGMEQGLISHLQGDFAGSDAKLDAIAPLVDELRGAHAVDAVTTSVYNDTISTYVGKPYEHTQVDYYRTLNNLLAAERAEGRWLPPGILLPAVEPPISGPPATATRAYEKAIITARRMTINQLKETEDAAGAKRYDDDPFARVLAAVTVLCEAPGARTESDQQLAAAMLTRAQKAYRAQAAVLGKGGEPFRYEVGGVPQVATELYLRHLKTYDPDSFTSECARLGFATSDPRVSPPSGSGMLLVLNHVGFIARPHPLQIGIGALGFESKDSTSFSWGAVTFYAKGPGSDIARTWVALPIPGDIVQKCLAPGGATVIGFEIPVHEHDQPIGGTATISVGAQTRVGEVVCDLDAYARSRLKDDQPHVLLKTLIRVAVKQGAVALGSAALKKKDNPESQLLAFAVNLVGSAVATATESADLRAWNTLPDHVEATLIDLPAGTYPASLTSYASGTQSLGTVRIDAGRLTLASVRTIAPIIRNSP